MASPSSISNWDDEADVIIVGYGMAGACAAIEAREADPNADVLVIEKMSEDMAGGNARVSGQSLLVGKNPEALAAYQRAMSAANPVPEDMLQGWAERMADLEPWIMERADEAGLKYSVGSGWSDGDAVLEFPEFGASEAVTHQSTILPTPSGVWLTMKGCAENRKPRFKFEMPLVDLVQDPDTLEVLGVVCGPEGARQAIKARRGVILACGGYENNLDMQRNYYGFTNAYPLGTPGNTGDGIKVLQKAGADMWHMRNRGQSGGIWPGFKVPDFEGGFLRNTLFTAFSWIDIAADDQRFYNETEHLHQTHYKFRHHGTWADVPLHLAQPVHMIFDDVTRQNMCLVTKFMSWNTVVNRYRWADDNQPEVDKGWISSAETIEELAEKIDRKPASVLETVNQFNSASTAGIDEQFGRTPATLSAISQGPFYAIEVVPTIVCTSGGAKRTIESEVLGHDGKCIPRLYEAGELGSMISDLYQNGSYLTEAMISGRAAGRNAVGLSAWAD